MDLKINYFNDIIFKILFLSYLFKYDKDIIPKIKNDNYYNSSLSHILNWKINRYVNNYSKNGY